MARLGKGAPTDLHELIAKQAGVIAQGIIASVRFAKTQLKLDKYEPTAAYISGAGAQAIGFTDALKDRLGMPVRLLNPFSGVLSGLPQDELDRASALPSPWTPAIGSAMSKVIELDADGGRARAPHAVLAHRRGAARGRRGGAAAAHRHPGAPGAGAALRHLHREPAPGRSAEERRPGPGRAGRGQALHPAAAGCAGALGRTPGMAGRGAPRAAGRHRAVRGDRPDPEPVHLPGDPHRLPGQARGRRHGGGDRRLRQVGGPQWHRRGAQGVRERPAQGPTRRSPPWLPQPKPISQDNQPFEYRIEIKDGSARD